MTWDILNSLWRIMVTMIAVYKLTQFAGQMINMERIGLGMMASGSIMTIPIIWEGQRSPFDGWAVSVMTVGMIVFLAGRTWRDRRHQRANDEMIRRGIEWQRQRSGQ